MNKRLNNILSEIWPAQCLACRARLSSGQDLCEACLRELPFLHHSCYRCSLPLPLATTSAQLCGACQRQPPVYQHSMSLFHYAPPINRWLPGLKFQQQLVIARVLGGLFRQHILAQTLPFAPQCIIPVPLHPMRQRQRGFNQAIELARPVAQALGLPLDLRHCRRQVNTREQSGLSARQRQYNLRQAFSVTRPYPFQRVIVFDDVMTTGNTAHNLALTLQSAGVEEIGVWCIARAELG